MNNYVDILAKEILSIKPEGLTKVRFAKYIYLIFKGLVQKEIFNAEDISFIRMPLGPVPFGFKDLVSRNPEIIIESGSIGLSYDRQTYKLKKNISPSVNTSVIKTLVKSLDGISTSNLVEYTHDEPSWIEHTNGDVYSIQKRDLTRVLPSSSRPLMDQDEDEQRLQGYLLNGMLGDIVNESTALEYPSEEKNT